MSETKPIKVLIFTTPSCGYCTAAKNYFKSKNIPYREIDITKDPDAQRDMENKSGQKGVPVIIINNRTIVGFDKQKIEDFIKKTNK